MFAQIYLNFLEIDLMHPIISIKSGEKDICRVDSKLSKDCLHVDKAVVLI